MSERYQRRTFLKALSLTTTSAICAPSNISAAPQPDSPVLVAYFSRTGNTRVIAKQICRTQNATLFEINVATPYPEDYEATLAQAKLETDAGYLPLLAQSVPGIQSYDSIYLGYPIWGMTVPPAIRSFLLAHNLTDKRVFPFITHGGYGLSNSIGVVKKHASQTNLQPAFSLEADQERGTLAQVSAWLETTSQTP